MDRRTSAKPGAQQVSSPGMIAVGQHNPRRPDGGELIEIGRARLDRVDAHITVGVTHKVAVEVVAMALRKSRPRQDVRDNFLHRSSCRPRGPSIGMILFGRWRPRNGASR